MQRHCAEKCAVIVSKRATGSAQSGLAQTHRLVEHRVEHRGEVARRAIDDLQYLGGRGLLVERLFQFGGAVLDLFFEVGVGFLEVRGHAVEVAGEVFELVAGLDVDVAVEFAGADPRGARLQLADRHGHAAGEKQRSQCRQDKGEGEQRGGAQCRAVERRQGFAQRQFDKDGPAERRDCGVRGQDRDCR